MKTGMEWQVLSLEASKRLKALGVKQESSFYWELRGQNITTDQPEWVLRTKFRTDEYSYSAFTVAELIEMLGEKFGVLERFLSGGFGAYVPRDCGVSAIAEKPSDALANLILEQEEVQQYLTEKGILRA